MESVFKSTLDSSFCCLFDSLSSFFLVDENNKNSRKTVKINDVLQNGAEGNGTASSSPAPPPPPPIAADATPNLTPASLITPSDSSSFEVSKKTLPLANIVPLICHQYRQILSGEESNPYVEVSDLTRIYCYSTHHLCNSLYAIFRH